MSVFNNPAVKALIPHVDLPRYFHVTSAPVGKTTEITVMITVKGKLTPFTATVNKTPPSLIDVLDSFPQVEVEKKMARMVLASIKLPAQWVLECKPGSTKKGFLVTFDTESGAHWEKEFDVSSLQLGEFIELLEWMRKVQEVG